MHTRLGTDFEKPCTYMSLFIFHIFTATEDTSVPMVTTLAVQEVEQTGEGQKHIAKLGKLF